MTEYRKGYKVDPKTGLTEPEKRAGMTRAEAEAGVEYDTPAPGPPASRAPTGGGSKRSKMILGVLFPPLPIYRALMDHRAGRNTSIALAAVAGIVELIIVIAVIAGIAGGGSSEPSAQTPSAVQTAPEPPPPPPPPSTKAANGDDITDLHNRAQDAVTRAHVCIIAVALAVSDTSSAVTMASNLQDARSICEKSRDELATNNSHGFSDEDTTLFASADEGRAATGAGLAYLDTQYPSKLADFRRHVQDAEGYFNQGFLDLNARLAELGVPRVRK
jgi:hypothetical protein